ncbi:hypothetical protein NFI96_000906 [Prochilodus magdalenae]|nr:hypothetical protein NFI96_000906 [Prochilodus magdalenae]
MFKLKLLLMVLACLEIGVGSADPPSPYPPVLTDRSPVKDLKEPLGRPSTRIRTVSVLCYPTYMEVWVKADLFGLGMSVDPADLRLGADRQSGFPKQCNKMAWCLVDGKVTGSNSYFLPRESPDKLRLQLDAFMFQQVKTDQIYITCTLKAYPLDYVSESMSKACSFISGSWRSAEGDDWTCSSCQNQFLLARSSMKLDSNASPRSQGKRTPLQSITQADSARWEPAKVITPKTLQEPATAWRSAWGSLRKADGSVDVENKVITDVEKTDLWKEQSTVAEDLEADGTSAPESESTATPMPFTTSSEPSTAKDHFLIPAVSLPENDTTVHFPLPVSPAAETQELDANTDSPFYPSTSTMLNATLLETVTFSMDSEDNPESLQEGPV